MRVLLSHLALDLLEAQGNPEQFARKIGATIGELETAAPIASQAMAETYVRAMQALLPHTPTPPSNNLLQPNTKWKLSEAEQDRFAAVVAAVFDPTSVLEEIAKGYADPRAIQVMSQVYPALTQHMIQDMLEKLGESSDDIPLGVKRQMSKLIQTPLYPTQTSFSISQSQKTFAPSEESQQQQGSPPKRQGSMDKLDKMGEGHRTRTQVIGAPL